MGDIMEDFIDYYRILGLNINSSTFEINNQFKQMTKKYHPDINKTVEAERIMKQLIEARSILTNPFKRETYDTEHSTFYRNQVPNKSNDINTEIPKQKTYKATDDPIYKNYIEKDKQWKASIKYKISWRVATILTVLVATLGLFNCIKCLANNDIGGFATNLFMFSFMGYCTFGLSFLGVQTLPTLFKSLLRDLKYILTHKGEGLGNKSLYNKLFFIAFFAYGAIEGYRTTYIRIAGSIFYGLLFSFFSIPVTYIFYSSVVEPIEKFINKYKENKLQL